VGQIGGGIPHAALWTAPLANAFVDLSPTNANGGVSSTLTGVSGNLQVGWAQPVETNAQGAMLPPFAGLWQGTPESFVGLNPSVGLGGSLAYGIAGNVQVGVVALGIGFEFEGYNWHAALWTGSADSFIDLEAAVGANWTYSSANQIYADATGVTIIGACDQGAVVWHIPAGVLQPKRANPRRANP
jgi:hypothetical protein